MIRLRDLVTLVFALFGIVFCLWTAFRVLAVMVWEPGSSLVALLLPVAVSVVFFANHRSLALWVTARAVRTSGTGAGARTLLGQVAFACIGAFLVLEAMGAVGGELAHPLVWNSRSAGGTQYRDAAWVGVLASVVQMALGVVLLTGVWRFPRLGRAVPAEGSA